MKRGFTRREFGLVTLAMAGALPGLTGAARGAAGGYAYPDLLVAPETLIDPAGDGHPRADAAALLIDIRPRAEYEAGHIPGARHLDPDAVAAPHSPVGGSLRSGVELERLLGDLGITGARRVLFYDDRGGFHAARMFWLLEYLGHRDVALLDGGLSGWRAAGGAVARAGAEEAGTEETLSGKGGAMAGGSMAGGSMAGGAVFQAAPSPRRYASADDVLARRADPDHLLIDVRPTAIFAKGHIPWAVNIPWAANLDAEARFLPATDLRAHFERHGIVPEKSVTMHCENGLASAHSYVALRFLGYPRLRVYHRSWAEWGSDPSLPKAVS